jgi:putative intracellular protease/amidase
MVRIAFLVTGAREIDLDESPAHPTGYWAEEALKSYERFVAAGADVVVITPHGETPVPDPYGLQPHFHYPDDDNDYFASVYRTFHHDPDDIRITLDHSTKQELTASRRIARRLEAAGSTPAEAHATVSAAAKIAWRTGQKLVDVMVAEGLDGGVPEEDLHAAVTGLETESTRIARERAGRLAAIPAFNDPVDLSSLTDEDIRSFDAVFAPGGHGPMVDMPENEDVSRLLGILQDKGALISSLCHGPAFLLAAPERADGQWTFAGYRFTCYTDDEEDQNEIGRLGMPFLLADALQNAGGILDDAPYAWASHVVVDRNLITGQNPNSTEATADAVIKALHLAAPVPA